MNFPKINQNFTAFNQNFSFLIEISRLFDQNLIKNGDEGA